MGLASKCHFVLGLPSGTLNLKPEIATIGTPMILKAHNFAYTLLIEMRSKAML
jgi:hypothetical protein